MEKEQMFIDASLSGGIEPQQAGTGAEMKRREFLKKIAIVTGALALAPQSLLSRTSGEVEKNEARENIGSVSTVIVEEFTKFCEEGCIFNSYEEMMQKYEATMKSIQTKIQTVDPNLFKNGITTQALQDIALTNGFHLALSSNEIKIDDQNKHAIFVGLHEIIHTESVVFKDYLPSVVASSYVQYPETKVLTVGKNLIKNFEDKIKQKAGLNYFSERGATSGGQVILYENGIKEAAKEFNISEEECKQMVLANEMGHVIFNHIFKDTGADLNSGLTFKYNNDKSYSFNSLDEAVSDITELNFGVHDRSTFMLSLNNIINRQDILVGYGFSTAVLNETLQEVMNDMQIYNRKIPKEEFDAFQKVFLDKANKKIFGVARTFVDYYRNTKQ